MGKDREGERDAVLLWLEDPGHQSRCQEPGGRFSQKSHETLAPGPLPRPSVPK